MFKYEDSTKFYNYKHSQLYIQELNNMSIIKIHLYRPHSAQQQKYILTYISQIHSTIRSFVEFAINALDIKLCGSDDVVVENDGYMIPLCLDGKVLQKITSLTIKVKTNITIDTKKPAQHITSLYTVQKPSDKLSFHKSHQQQQANQHPSQRIQEQEQHDQQSQSTPKFSQDGLADKSKKQLIIENLIKKKQTNKINQQISKHKKAQTLKTKAKVNKTDKKQKKVELSQESQSSQQLELEKVTDKKRTPQLKKGTKKVQSFQKQSSQQSSESQQQQQHSQQKQSSQQQQRSGSQSSSQSSQSSEEELPRVIRTKKAQLKSKVQEKQQHKKDIKNAVVDKRLQLVAKVDEKKFENRQQQPSLSQSKFTKKGDKPLLTNNQQKQQQHQQIQQQFIIDQKSKTQKPSRQFPVTYANRKKLIQVDDIESSDSSSVDQSQLMAKLTVKPVVGNICKSEGVNVSNSNNNNKTIVDKQHVVGEIKTVVKMLPPSLRNKSALAIATTTNQKSSPIIIDQQQSKKPSPSTISPFKQHQLQQWLTVTKQILTTYKQTLPEQKKQKPFLKPNNLIKFKQIELDEQRFVPKQSQWIEGTVQSVDEKDGKIVLVKVSQLGREYRERLQAYEHNMVVLEVNRNYLTQGQRSIILANNDIVDKEINSIPLQQQQQQQQPQPQSLQQQQPLTITTSDKTSLQKFICGQVNYYFSQKNYPFDLFMQMHANKHPQKYIPIRFMLNFPKIKKVLKDEHKLVQYLIEDEKQPQRNYQIDPIRKLVRKRIVDASTPGEAILQEQKQNNNEKLQQIQ